MTPAVPDPAPLEAPDGAVVLTGGSGRRLGGVAKATIRVEGRTLLATALAATGGIADVVVVGPTVPGVTGARFVREEPPGGGPAAGIVAGVRALTGPRTVLVLAVDMLRVTTRTVARLAVGLAEAGGSADGAVLHDVRRQPLCGVYRTDALLAAAPDDTRDLSVHALLADLHLVEVPALAGEAHDIDTWDDLA